MTDTQQLPRILCVDDNRDIADSAADLLKLYGYPVRSCYDGRTAITLSKVFEPDICLIDLNMPGMDGDEVAVRLRKASPGLILVAVTARSDEVGCRRIKAAGFDLHLVKPINPSQLPEVLTALWRKRAGATAGS